MVAPNTTPERILFLGGHRKCGTTMLSNLLDGHPQLAVFPQDINTLYAYYPLFLDKAYSDDDRLARLGRVIFDDLDANLADTAVRAQVDLGTMREAFFADPDSFDPTDMRQVLTRQLGTMVRHGATPAWFVAKETSSEIYACELFDWFPDAKFIHLVRDPRDNYAALKAGVTSYYASFGDSAGTLLASLVHRYTLGLRAALFNREHFGPDRYLIVRFEDLVAEPQKTVSAIVNFLEIDFSNSLMRPSILGQPTAGNSHEEIEMFEISDHNAGRWHERITDLEAQAIEFHFGDLMSEFGYACSYDAQDQMRAAAELYRFSNYQYFYHDRFAATGG